MASTDDKKYLDEGGLEHLVECVKSLLNNHTAGKLLTDEYKNYLDKQIFNVTTSLDLYSNSARTTALSQIEYGRSTPVYFKIQTKSASVLTDADATPTISPSSNNISKSATGTYIGQATSNISSRTVFTATSTVKKIGSTASKTVNAYSKIQYGGSTSANVLKNTNEIDTTKISLTTYSLQSTSQGKAINISAPTSSSTYYGYILIPVGTKDGGGTSSSLGLGGVTVATNLKSTTQPAAALPGGATIYFTPVSTDTPEYVYMQPFSGAPIVKYRFIRTPELSSSLYPTITITLN